MANIFDYLDWRGDMPLFVDPFNEVDSLILSMLAYTDFRDVVPGDGSEVPIRDAYRAFFSRYTREEVLARKSYTAKSPLLMEQMVSGARFRSMTLSHHVNEFSAEKEVQMSAVTFHLPDGLSYVAFRGTDGTLVGWKEDFTFSFQPQTRGQSMAVHYLNWAGRQTPGRLIVGGHSKGGHLAVYASAGCDADVQERIEAVYSYDGPGFRQEVIDSPGYHQVLPRVKSIIPDTSVIGLLLSSLSEHRVIKSTASGLTQHDAFTWSVQRNRFVDARLNPASEGIDKVLGSWLEQTDDETKKNLTDQVFNMFSSAGGTTMSEVTSEQKWKSAGTIATVLLNQLGQGGLQALSGLLGKREEPAADSGRKPTLTLPNALDKP